VLRLENMFERLRRRADVSAERARAGIVFEEIFLWGGMGFCEYVLWLKVMVLLRVCCVGNIGATNWRCR